MTIAEENKLIEKMIKDDNTVSIGEYLQEREKYDLKVPGLLSSLSFHELKTA